MATVTFQDQQVRELKSERARALVCPEGGGRLLNYTVDDIEVVVWPDNSDFSKIAKVRGGNPVLFPVVARHMVNGEVGLAKYPGNEQVFKLPMHGFARDSKFDVVEHTETCLRMMLRSTKETVEVYPFDFAFQVTYLLTGEDKSDLSVEFRTVNLSQEPMPYYPGHHFYFNVNHEERAQWSVDVPANAWGYQDDQGNIVRRDKDDKRNTLNEEILIDNFHLDLVKDQPVFLTNNAKQYSIEIDLRSPTEWFNVTTWALKPDSDHYCVEPWLGLPNALHHNHGLRLLQPQHEESAVCTLRLKKGGERTGERESRAAVAALESRSIKPLL